MKGFSDKNAQVEEQLERAFERAKQEFTTNPEVLPDFGVSEKLREAIDAINLYGDNDAQTALTNIVTALAIKAAYPSLDTRYHMARIQVPTKHFSHRPVSEKVVYPWLDRRKFDGAKSGWQTRVFERPRPYMLDYDEAISAVKDEFLFIYDAIEERNESASGALSYLIFGQIVRREAKRINLIRPNVSDIGTIIEHFSRHFFESYSGKGASRLPVLAIHSLYRLILPELRRFDGFDLADLELHSAADARTGATGDIEIKQDDGSVFEAVEIKHDIPITIDIVESATQKLIDRSVDRYYILTTSENCNPSADIVERVRSVQAQTGCQMIVNGVVPTMKYYLRLVSDPSKIFQFYTELLKDDKDIGFEHRERWNEIILA